MCLRLLLGRAGAAAARPRSARAGSDPPPPQDKIAKLLRFPSSREAEKGAAAGPEGDADDADAGLNMTSLQQYVDRMLPGQKGGSSPRRGIRRAR